MPEKSSIIELARELTRSMAEMRHHLRQFMQLKIKEQELDITYELLETVMYLNRLDGAKQQEIADIMIKDKSSMTYLIDNLVKREMLIATINPWISEIYEMAVDGVKASEIERSIAVVQSMIQNLKK